MKAEFFEYGIDLIKFLVASISLPENVEAALDKRTSMGIIGDMNKFTQFQVAESMEAAANNPSGGGASTGMGMGMGFGMANAMMGQMGQGNQSQSAPPPVPGATTYFVAIGGQQSGPFDLNALKQMVGQGQINKDTLVWKQGMAQWEAASTQTDLHSIFGAVPPPLPPK
jgi:hypothetical protein